MTGRTVFCVAVITAVLFCILKYPHIYAQEQPDERKGLLTDISELRKELSDQRDLIAQLQAANERMPRIRTEIGTVVLYSKKDHPNYPVNSGVARRLNDRNAWEHQVNGKILFVEAWWVEGSHNLGIPRGSFETDFRVEDRALKETRRGFVQFAFPIAPPAGQLQTRYEYRIVYDANPKN